MLWHMVPKRIINQLQSDGDFLASKKGPIIPTGGWRRTVHTFHNSAHCAAPHCCLNLVFSMHACLQDTKAEVWQLNGMWYVVWLLIQPTLHASQVTTFSTLTPKLPRLIQ